MSKILGSGMLALALAAVSGIRPEVTKGQPYGPPLGRYTDKRSGNSSGHTPHQGKREMARRAKRLKEKQ